MKKTILALLILLVVPQAQANNKNGIGKFHELDRFQLGEEGGWDYLITDAAARRLYIARSNRIMIVGADSGKSLGQLTGLDGAHGVALLKDRGIAYASRANPGRLWPLTWPILKFCIG